MSAGDSIAVVPGESVDSDENVRRPVRARKEPDRFVVTKASAPRKKAVKEPPFIFEMVMGPPPADLRGIIKPERRVPFPPPRKSSLSVTAGRTITKKYRKVRVSRKLQYKVITPLPGWRPDRSRMPEDEPDEEEQNRLEEEEKKAVEAQKKKRKRKSIGVTSVRSTSDEEGVGEGVEEDNGIASPKSPDLFYEGYIRASTPDSVLTSDSEAEVRREENRNVVAQSLFPPIKETSNEDERVGPSDVVDTVATGDTVATAAPPIDARKQRRRSVRIQPLEEDKPKAQDRKERRKSKMFPVTPVKESPKPVQKTVRRRSMAGHKAPLQKDEEPIANIPWNDVPCRSDEQVAAADAKEDKKKKNKVMMWLEKNGSTARETAGGDADKIPESAAQLNGKCGEIESTRGADSLESLVAVEKSSSSSSRLVEAPNLVQSMRKGRRSMKMAREDLVSKSSKSKSEGEDKKKHHPFFSKFGPKSSPAETTVATVPVEKKPARRRTMFVPKNPPAAKQGTSSPVNKEDDEEAIEIVAEVTKEKKKQEEGEEGTRDASQPGDTTSSIWHSTEIDAAPYAGLVHVGREEEKKEGEEVVVKRMRRLSVQQPRLSSYAIPSSLRNEEPEPVKMVPVFDEERKEECLSERAATLSQRARDLAAAADAAVPWPEAMRPRKVEECIGDQEVLASGKRWLQKWKKRLDAVCAEEEKATKEPKAKKKKRRGGAYSDESEQEDSDSDYELRDEEHRLPNPLVLSGPVGCGKTAYIRALSDEVGFCLLESSPDERRAGSNLRAKLAGAVANYRMSSKPAGGIASFFSPKTGGEEQKKNGEEERKDRKHTLVVIEHVDVVFTEEDKLFWPALAEILATTKIPIVLTCNVVPVELTAVLRQAEASGAEPMEITMEREGGRTVEEYVEATLAGSSGRVLSATVIPAIAARARQDLRAALHDAHWAAAATALNQMDLASSSMRRVDDPAMCDTVVRQSFAWSDECARKAETSSINSDLSRAAEWPSRCGMPGEVYARLCKEIDEIDEDAYRVSAARAERMLEMARSGVGAGSGGRSGLLTRREIAMDWMPMLEQIDRREQEMKRTNGRRHQHYFNVIKDLNTGVSIDPLDRIQGACSFFRLPQSHN